MSLYRSRMGLCSCTAVSRMIQEKLTFLVVPTCSSLNMAWISVWLRVSAHLPPNGYFHPMVTTWCAGAGMLWNVLSWDLNEPHYNNKSSKPVCAVAAGCELIPGAGDLMSGCWKSLLLTFVSCIDFWGLKNHHIQAALGLCPKYFVDSKSCGFKLIQKKSLKERRFLVSEEETWKLMEPELGE